MNYFSFFVKLNFKQFEHRCIPVFYVSPVKFVRSGNSNFSILPADHWFVIQNRNMVDVMTTFFGWSAVDFQRRGYILWGFMQVVRPDYWLEWIFRIAFVPTMEPFFYSRDINSLLPKTMDFCAYITGRLVRWHRDSWATVCLLTRLGTGAQVQEVKLARIICGPGFYSPCVRLDRRYDCSGSYQLCIASFGAFNYL